ncbi:hypothetical protein F5Y16DRAFT_401967 [Xylariaceae sp. FL0255]|nr:hypothetical protein F5Y16DRAFT_401967 [Xylariaceae sp. FL0255]
MHTTVAIALAVVISVIRAHVVVTYPGWRGDNLQLSGTVEGTNGAGVGISSGELVYPYGMQFIYPCGGLPQADNRTNWPVGGGAVAFQPGWYTNHKTAQIYVNIGLGSLPANYTIPLTTPFEVVGPSDNPYPGTLCLPLLSLPAGYAVQVGDLATIQVIELTEHGQSLYSCVDITFADSSDVAALNETNCFNSSTISFKEVSTTVGTGANTTGDIWGSATGQSSRASLFPTSSSSSAGAPPAPTEAAILGKALGGSLMAGAFGMMMMME